MRFDFSFHFNIVNTVTNSAGKIDFSTKTFLRLSEQKFSSSNVVRRCSNRQLKKLYVQLKN